MVARSDRKGRWPDSRFSMNPALPDNPSSLPSTEGKNGGGAERQEGPLARQPFFDESGLAGFIITGFLLKNKDIGR